MCRGGGSERMAKMNMKNREMKEEKRKKRKRQVAQDAQQESETEQKKEKQDRKATNEEEDLIAEEDLTAEERRKLERKLKKERKKEEKKLMREAGISSKKEEPKKPSGSELALAYLTSWSEKPEEWKFQKTRQTWLLLHMYDKEKDCSEGRPASLNMFSYSDPASCPLLSKICRISERNYNTKGNVPDEYFTILLDYLQGLKGSARDVTVQKAEALMKELDDSDAEDASLVEKSERIRQVLQLLS